MTARAAAVLALSLVCAACASSTGPIVGRPPLPPGLPEQFVHFSDAVVGVGDVAPDFALPTAEGFGEIRLSELRGGPVVVVFASHT